ncbi:MAG TPA: hypothetical protein VNT81_02415 [Vicinamibacterales bacterium]|nr:hypothetical protein [Vicinamibacterales bacterium]
MLAGVALGIAYTFSPLTIISLLIVVPVWRWASANVTGAERRWLLLVVLVAVALRAAAIAGLFLTADPDIPYANFFGDEEFFKRKSTWLRNVAMGIPISTADFIYAYDTVGDSGYVWALTYLQAVVGLAPYGIHALNASLYLIAVLGLYRLARESFGGAAAVLGLTLLLYLPSLFFWSISALKEPAYFLAAAISLTAAVWVVRAPGWWKRAIALVVLLAGAYLLQSLREGGLLLASAGVLGGLAAAFLVARPRRLLVAVIVLPVVLVVIIPRPAVQDRMWAAFREVAMKHWGHVNTPGQSYQLMDTGFYIDRRSVERMHGPDAARYLVNALWSYVTVPLPWQIESRSAFVYVPEQMVWFVMLLLTPLGLFAALRKDAVVASLLAAHAAAAVVMVALSGGNVGTLVRHRGLAMPYLVWLAALGLVTLHAYVLSRRQETMPNHSSQSKAGSCMALVDDRGRIFGRFNLIDLAIAVLLLGLIPLAYGSYLLFRTPPPTLTSVEPAVMQLEPELRLRINGTNLRPYMRVSLDNNQTRQFLFRDANTAEVVFTDVPPGQYDVVLYDVAQERSRLPKGLTITPPALPSTYVHAAGFLTGVTDRILGELKPGYRFFGFAEILKVGRSSQDVARVTAGDRPLEIPIENTTKVELLLKIPCTVRAGDSGVANCLAGSPNGPGVFLGSALAPDIYLMLPVLDIRLPFLITQVQPPIDPTQIEITVRVATDEDAGELARVGDTDIGFRQNQYASSGVITRALHGRREITMRLPAFATLKGWEYSGQTIRVGAPLMFITPRYQMSAVITDVPEPPSR